MQRWFVKRRGFASGLAVSGIGVGTLIMPPLAALAVGTLGWRHAYLVLGILATVVGGHVHPTVMAVDMSVELVRELAIGSSTGDQRDELTPGVQHAV